MQDVALALILSGVIASQLVIGDEPGLGRCTLGFRRRERGQVWGAPQFLVSYFGASQMTEARDDRNDGSPGRVCFPRVANVWFPSPALLIQKPGGWILREATKNKKIRNKK